MEDRVTLRDQRPRRSVWQKIVDLALTDVSVLMRGVETDAIERLEQVLLESDFGVDAAMYLGAELERAARRGEVSDEKELRAWLRARIREILASAGAEVREEPPAADAGGGGGPQVTLVLGVNGTGKTTTAAKLAWRAICDGRKALLAATDTFRSGAVEQLRLWAERVGAEFVGGQAGGDPAAVAYDAAQAAVARGIDRMIVDTAGRLHTQRNLMEELRKVDRVVGRIVPGAPHERLLVVDATAGQNVLSQVREFGEIFPLSGLVLAKYDSSARGGTAVAVAREFALPVRYLGTGERPQDLMPFDPDGYVDKLLA